MKKNGGEKEEERTKKKEMDKYELRIFLYLSPLSFIFLEFQLDTRPFGVFFA